MRNPTQLLNSQHKNNLSNINLVLNQFKRRMLVYTKEIAQNISTDIYGDYLPFVDIITRFT